MSETVVRSGLRRLVLVSGLSGAGKSTVMHALEDLGYEAVDNPPLDLIDELVTRPDPSAKPRRMAVGVDARTRGFDALGVLDTISRLRGQPNLHVDLVFVWADEAVLLRRYTETRRRHPLSSGGRVSDGIAAEQTLTGLLRENADLVIDSTELAPTALRQVIEQYFGQLSAIPCVGLGVSLVSFAFPAGLPREADMVLDARFLRNPHYVADLKHKTGLDRDVAVYVEADYDFGTFFERAAGLLDLVLPRFVREGKKYVMIAVGCTGGRHRSVFIVERLATHLSEAGWRVTSFHRELMRQSIAAGRANRDDAQNAIGPSVQAQEA